jgi:hypothetical protein
MTDSLEVILQQVQREYAAIWCLPEGKNPVMKVSLCALVCILISTAADYWLVLPCLLL